MKNLKLGLVARDKITGFKGIIIAHSEYLTGCDQYGLQPKVKEDGIHVEPHWFDEGRIEIVEGEEGVDPDDILAEKNGCDVIAPLK